MINGALQQYITAQFRKHLLLSFRDAPQIQKMVLFNILKANAQTTFGLQHTFARIQSIQDYQQTLPICSYEDIAELIVKIAAGETNILTSERVCYLQATSGTTTGQPKFIPVTSTHQRHIWWALLASQGFLHDWASHQRIHHGRGLLLSSTLPFGVTEGHVPYGSASSHITTKASLLWKAVSITPFEITQIADPETRRYIHWLFALHTETSAYVSAPYMAPLITFASLLFHRSEELIRDIANGTLSNHLSLPLTQREKLTAKLRADHQRAKQLERLANSDGGLTPRSIWPELGWILTVYGPSFQSYEHLLAKWYGQQSIWGLPYLACEGIIGIPFTVNSYSHLPVLRASFLEFIPEEAWSKTQPDTCLIHELEVGKRYDVVLTSWNGMYRYRMNDIIQVDGTFKGIPTFQVLSRRASVLSIAWERTAEAQVVQAVAAATSDYALIFTDFVVDIDREVVPPRYRIWIEASLQVEYQEELLQKALDKHLGLANANYRLLRDCGEIGEPVVQNLPQGIFEQIRQRRELAGFPAEQLKVLHTVTDWRYGLLLGSNTQINSR